VNKLLVKILWGKQSYFQLVLTLLALVVGVLVMAITFNLYLNFKEVLSDNDAFSNNYLVINKSVGYLNTFGLTSTSFKAEEIEDIKNSKKVKGAVPFIANQFDVAIRKGAPFNFYSELFVEGVPRNFIDNVPNEFRWQEGDAEVPVILSNEMYNLLSFGYSPTKTGFPQVPKSALMSTDFDLELRGVQKDVKMKTRIVGFSDRVNSILVPLEFLEWANKNIGRGAQNDFSRVLLEVEDAADHQLQEFLDAKGYVANKDKLLAGSGKSKIKLFLSVLGLIGGLIVILTLNTLVMNIQLLISKAKAELKMLFSLGYRLNTLFSYMFYGFVVMQLFPLIIIYAILPFLNASIQQGLNEFMPNLQMTLFTEVLALPIAVLVLSVLVMAVFLKRFLRLSVLSD